MISTLVEVELPLETVKLKGCPKIQFRNSNLQELSETDINPISTFKAQEFQKQYGKETGQPLETLK